MFSDLHVETGADVRRQAGADLQNQERIPQMGPGTITRL
jgi:hypothetical protein